MSCKSEALTKQNELTGLGKFTHRAACCATLHWLLATKYKHSFLDARFAWLLHCSELIALTAAKRLPKGELL